MFDECAAATQNDHGRQNARAANFWGIRPMMRPAPVSEVRRSSSRKMARRWSSLSTLSPGCLSFIRRAKCSGARHFHSSASTPFICSETYGRDFAAPRPVPGRAPPRARGHSTARHLGDRLGVVRGGVLVRTQTGPRRQRAELGLRLRMAAAGDLRGLHVVAVAAPRSRQRCNRKVKALDPSFSGMLERWEESRDELEQNRSRRGTLLAHKSSRSD